MGKEFFVGEFTTSGMGIVIVIYLCVTLKTKRNGVFDIVASSIGFMFDMMEFHLNATKTMTNATAPVTLGKKS